MAQLKDTLITGDARVTGNIYGNVKGNADSAIKDGSGNTITSYYQPKLTTQTAYSAKGSATKVPQITTNSLGQVTGITEVTISAGTSLTSSDYITQAYIEELVGTDLMWDGTIV